MDDISLSGTCRNMVVGGGISEEERRQIDLRYRCNDTDANAQQVDAADAARPTMTAAAAKGARMTLPCRVRIGPDGLTTVWPDGTIERNGRSIHAKLDEEATGE